ncbi:hypothetical protein NST44_30965 [Paenibacillus sp. FSL W8-0919]|uniref:hypothetical protein n=1 Tax=Paenibacillus sp. FSL W8-0919 TaxID=2954707 RepID=UPI0030F9F6AD
MMVYRAEDGTAYTQEEINALIDHYLSNTPGWSIIESRLFPLVRGVLYHYVLALATWEHPATILDQIDDEERSIIIERVNAILA